MHKYVAAAFSIAIAIEPVAGQAGGMSVGTSASVGGVGGTAAASVGTSKGSIGASVGASGGGTASVGTSKGSTGASVGASGGGTASVGTSKGSTGASVGASGGGTASVGTSTGSTGASVGASSASGGLSTGSGGAVSSATGAAGISPRSAAARNTATTTAGVAPADGVGQSITLPPILLPGGGDRASAATAFNGIPGTPAAVVRACAAAVGSAAAPFGVVSVRARSAGSLRRLSQGAISAPILIRIHYARQGGPEIRQARIRCHLDASGKVRKLT